MSQKKSALFELFQSHTPDQILDMAEAEIMRLRAEGNMLQLWHDSWITKFWEADEHKDVPTLLACAVDACEMYLRASGDPKYREDTGSPSGPIGSVFLSLEFVKQPPIDTPYYHALVRMQLKRLVSDNPDFVTMLLKVIKEMQAGTLTPMSDEMKRSIRSTYISYCKQRGWENNIFKD